MYTINHFFAYLVHARGRLQFVPNLTDFPFPSEPLSYQNRSGFPSLALRMNPRGDPPGGEVIGLKDSASYSIPAFSSHIPTGMISIASLELRKAKALCNAAQAAGEDAHALPNREVYYLIRGRRSIYTKICLVHGSFFAILDEEQVVSHALSQVLLECVEAGEEPIYPEQLDLLSIALAREILSREYRSVENASVAFRVEVDTNVISKGNVLDSEFYPAIRDDTISIVVPYDKGERFREGRRQLRSAFTEAEWQAGRKMVIHHPFNGPFFVLSYAL